MTTHPAVRGAFGLASLVLLSFFIVLLMNPEALRSLPIMENPNVQTFKTMFVSITLEAFPFILLGVLVSSLIQVFVPESFIRRLVPKHPILGAGAGALLGFVFPVCECGMVPVARRLIRKGMPVYAAVAFLLAGPILNPVVWSATYMAFRFEPAVLYSRMGLAFAVATVVALAVFRWVRYDPMKPAPAHAHDHSHDHARKHNSGGAGKLLDTFDHASGEFFDMGKYLIFGAFLTALMQTFVPRSALVGIAEQEWAANAFMMGFAYILSICSTSDAFVAASLAATFAPASLVAFLVFGPMLDLKSTLMLLSVFKARFVASLAALVAAAVWVGAYITGLIID
ncbi:permease [Paenibacillus sp.]|uniref:permease n=1 Tax=Paenibacillus sp. TaxID=58172 RepID=UPI002D24FFC7|nr:permease [Paenibacillus sp.]HZG56981.1 permease [Paenibacillus sp.]